MKILKYILGMIIYLSLCANLTFASDYTYTNQEQDKSGLLHYDSRYYDPDLGRFLQPDSYDVPNKYAYVSNDPVNRVDPTGHEGVPNADQMNGFDSSYGTNKFTQSFPNWLAGCLGLVCDMTNDIYTAVVGTAAESVGLDPNNVLNFIDDISIAPKGSLSIATNPLIGMVEGPVVAPTAINFLQKNAKFHPILYPTGFKLNDSLTQNTDSLKLLFRGHHLPPDAEWTAVKNSSWTLEVNSQKIPTTSFWHEAVRYALRITEDMPIRDLGYIYVIKNDRKIVSEIGGSYYFLRQDLLNSSHILGSRKILYQQIDDSYSWAEDFSPNLNFNKKD